MQRVYFISGLGADKRAFSLLDLSFCEPVFVDWIRPLPNESLKSYASRLRQQIPEEHPTVVGVSFGGMLATEMARADEKMKVVIISSNKCADEFPFYLRLGKFIPVYKMLPRRLIRISSRFNWFFGAKGKPQQELLAAILKDVDPAFLKWAIGAILNWREKTIPANLRHIHGTKDRLLLFRYVKPDVEVAGGTHLMSLNMPVEISRLLQGLLK